MCYPVGIHCCQWPNCDFCISHGSRQHSGEVAKTTDLCIKFLFNVACQKLFKLANVSQSYWKKIIVACFMDQGTLFFNSSIASCKNKEYLIAVFKHWLKSCKEFFSEHFAENRLTLWCTVAKLWCRKLCAVFWTTLYMVIQQQIICLSC